MTTVWKQKQLASYAGSIASGVAVTAVVSPVLWLVEIPGFPDQAHKGFFPVYLVVVSILFFWLERKTLATIPREHQP